VLENLVLRTSPEWHLALNDWVYSAIAVTGWSWSARSCTPMRRRGTRSRVSAPRS
jgi:hypothetical protein